MVQTEAKIIITRLGLKQGVHKHRIRRRKVIEGSAYEDQKIQVIAVSTYA
jgi:hypothetical protein